MITLALLLTAVTGAWADGIVCTASDLGKVLCTDGSIYENVSAATTAGKTAAAVIAYVDETNKNGLALALTDADGQTWDNSSPSNKGKTAPEICSALNTSKPVTGGTWKLPSQDDWKQMFSANGGNEGSYSGLSTAIGNAGGTALVENDAYWSSSELDEGDAWLVNLANGNASWDTYGKHYSRCIRACLAFDIASASSGPKVAWDKDKNTGKFTMPGGNVTLEPEYYPQATVAEGAVTAADADARATTDDPLVKVDATKLTGAKKLMYFVSNSGTTAPAYDDEGWTDQLPTAESLTQQGIVYVYYYPVGTDEGVDGATATYSDGDICLQSITARIADAPTYAVTFADGVNPEPPAEPEWTASPNTGVTKGQTVTVTYTGSKKVIGVKAEKKAKASAYTLLSAATAEDYGKVVCAAGHLHDAKTAVPDGCTAVGILGKVTETGHGLILALQKSYFQDWYTINGWTSASYAGTTLKVLPDDARGTDLTSYTTLGETTVSNWAVGQKSDYEAIFTNLGSTTGNSDGKTYDANVNAYITSVGGMAIAGEYWSATDDDDDPWYFDSSSWSNRDKGQSNSVWPVLGF